MSELDRLRSFQSGVLSRSQLLEHGVDETMQRRLLRRRDLVTTVPGVYVDHTGPLTWVQQAWVGVLYLWPAALSHQSAIRLDDGPGRRGRDDLIHLAIDRHRSRAAPPGVQVHHLEHLQERVLWNLGPPRVRIEQAVVDVASEARSPMECIATLADAVQARRTTAARLREALDSRARIAQRDLMLDVLADVSSGTCSVLERGYLSLVERPHGLPVARRQALLDRPRPGYADVEYAEQGVRIELDGRLFHDSAAARDRDLDRDLDSAIEGATTARLGWGQVFDRPCTTAGKVGVLLQARGWLGRVAPCPRCATGATGRVA